MDDVAVLEVYSGQRATNLGADLELLDRGKLAKEAKSGVDFPQQRLAHHHLWQVGRSNGRNRFALTIRIGQPCRSDDGDDQGCRCAGKQSASGDVCARHRSIPWELLRS
jgi:hypothetical protein